MTIDSIISVPAVASLIPASVAAANSGFKEALEKVAPAPASAAEKSEARKQAEEAAAGLVSSALILPILKQVRRSVFNTGGPFSPGIGEKTFGPEFDMHLADSIAHSPRLGIRNALADRLMQRNTAAGKMPAAPKDLDVHG